MGQPIKQPDLLSRILAEIQDKTDYDAATWKQIHACLWKPDAIRPLPADEALQQSIDFLQDLVQQDHLTSLEEIAWYLMGGRARARRFVNEMMDRIDRQRITDELNVFVSFLDPAITRPSVRTRGFIDPILRFLSSDLSLSFPFHGAYQRPSSTYFQQFTEHRRAGHMYVLEYFSNEGIEACSATEVANKLAVTEPQPNRSADPGDWQTASAIHFNYDHLLDILIDEERRSDFSFKVGIAGWLLLTLLDHGTLWANQAFGLPDDSKPAPIRASELFESWVYDVMVGSLADKQWCILKSPTHLSWVTCDKPGFVLDKRAEAERPVLSGYGLRHLNGIRSFYYPLSRDYCLRLDSTGQPDKGLNSSAIRIEVSSEQEVNELNELTIFVGKEMGIASDKKMLELFK